MPNITIYLPEREAAILAQLAEKENRSVSNTVGTLIRNFTNVAISSLPHPQDAQAVPVLHVSSSTK